MANEKAIRILTRSVKEADEQTAALAIEKRKIQARLDEETRKYATNKSSLESEIATCDSKIRKIVLSKASIESAIEELKNA